VTDAVAHVVLLGAVRVGELPDDVVVVRGLDAVGRRVVVDRDDGVVRIDEFGSSPVTSSKTSKVSGPVTSWVIITSTSAST